MDKKNQEQHKERQSSSILNPEATEFTSSQRRVQEQPSRHSNTQDQIPPQQVTSSSANARGRGLTRLRSEPPPPPARLISARHRLPSPYHYNFVSSSLQFYEPFYAVYQPQRFVPVWGPLTAYAGPIALIGYHQYVGQSPTPSQAGEGGQRPKEQKEITTPLPTSPPTKKFNNDTHGRRQNSSENRPRVPSGSSGNRIPQTPPQARAKASPETSEERRAGHRREEEEARGFDDDEVFFPNSTKK
ncbi:hypothetical protein F5Y19DRAFT_480342 [Xylariaceae sp. FL1651]|nr:hypothetical protein F5Y19DRAFT_480342 [Xylariaceae sp. FL1651]